MNFLAVSFKFLSLLGGFATVGVILAMAFLLLDQEGKLSTSGEKLRTIFKISATLWIVGAIGNIVFTLAQILATPLSGALDLTVLRSFITQITLGRYLAFQVLIALIVLGISFSAKKILTLIFAMLIALVALVAPALQSHSASGGSHSLVIGSLVIHVFALALWVGGVFAVGLLSENDRAIAVPRFSQLALWSAVAVVISGGVNACLLYTSPSPRDTERSRMPSSA